MYKLFFSILLKNDTFENLIITYLDNNMYFFDVNPCIYQFKFLFENSNSQKYIKYENQDAYATKNQ